jgi:hypothetical protein
MIALSLFKGATKNKELAVPKGSCENRVRRTCGEPFAIAESNISMFCDAFLGNKNTQAAKFPKRNWDNQLLAAWGCQLHTWTATSFKR